MKNSEKCIILRQLTSAASMSEYYNALKKLGDMKSNYGDYLITEPVNCNIELERLPGSDYDLCCALLTMLLREDHFSNGSFERRCKSGQVQAVVDKMISLLSDRE